jgi:hypothetical protein
MRTAGLINGPEARDTPISHSKVQHWWNCGQHVPI